MLMVSTCCWGVHPAEGESVAAEGRSLALPRAHQSAKSDMLNSALQERVCY